MSKEKLYGLRDQLSKFLYDPTPEQAAWRKKMWDEGRFDESMDITKQLEARLEEVEKQIEAVEAGEPELGEKMVTNFLLNLPLGKQLKGTGLGSLLGLAEEKMGAAEAQRLKDIEREINQLNAIRQKDLEEISPRSLSKIDSDIETLEDEAYELKQLLGTQLSDEPEWLPEENQFEPSPREQAEWETENFRQKQLGERAEKFLNVEEAAQEEAYYNRIEGDPEGPPSPPSGGDGNGGPTREDVLKYINTLSLKERLGAYTPYGELYDEEIFQYEDLFDWDKDVVNWENIPDDYRSEGQELARAFFEKNQISEKFETDLVKDFTYRGKSQPYFEDVGMDKIRVRVPRQGTDYGSGAKYSQKTFTNPTYGELKEWFAGLEQGPKGIVKPTKGYQAGGLVMNYGDYGRSYV